MCMQIYFVLGQDAIRPGVELCRRTVSDNCKTFLIIPSDASVLVPSTFRPNTMTEVLEIPATESVPTEAAKQFFEDYLRTRRANEDGPVGAIVDVSALHSMGWVVGVFHQNHIRVAGFFNTSAYSAAMEYKASSEDVKESGGLFKCFSGCALVRCGPKVIGLSGPGEHPPWIDFAKEFMGVIINTCDVLERRYMDELNDKLKLRVWGVGPQFPEKYFKLFGNVVPPSSASEATVVNWLNSRPRRSVLFVSFGPSGDLPTEEYQLLVEALEASEHPFIWVMPPASHSGGYYPTVGDTVGERGFITSERVPHSLILNHPCVAGFLSHCDWETATEAIGLGVPLSVWPKTGKQFYNAELVVKKLKVGRYAGTVNGIVTAKSIKKGIDTLMTDERMRRTTADLGAQFSPRFPQSSKDSLDNFTGILRLI